MLELASEMKLQEATGASTWISEDSVASQHLDEDGQLAAGLASAVAKMAAMSTEPEVGRTCFHAVRTPSMSLEKYAARLHQYFRCSGGCYVLALVYLDRLIERCPAIGLSPRCCHRLLLASLVVAVKFHDDVYYSDVLYAKCGGVRVKELNVMVARLVELLDWRLHVQPEEYELYRDLCEVASEGAAPMPARCA